MRHVRTGLAAAAIAVGLLIGVAAAQAEAAQPPIMHWSAPLSAK